MRCIASWKEGSRLANILENGIPYIKSDNDTAFNILQKICTNKITIKGYVLCHKKKLLIVTILKECWNLSEIFSK